MRWLRSGKKEYFTESYPSYILMLVNRFIRTRLDGLHLVKTIKVLPK